MGAIFVFTIVLAVVLNFFLKDLPDFLEGLPFYRKSWRKYTPHITRVIILVISVLGVYFLFYYDR